MRQTLTTIKHNTNMKKLLTLSLLTVCLLGLTVSAKAQATYAPITLFSASTITNSTAFNNSGSGYVLDVRKQNTVVLQMKGQPHTAAAATATIAYSLSVDGSTYDTTLVTTNYVSSATLSATVQKSIPIDVSGYGYLKIAYITNASGASDITNCSLIYGQKLLNGK